MPSSQLSDYDFGEILGVGTVGTIYAATQRGTGERVAIKKLHPGVSQDPLIRARFKREMMILERLRHPNIVAYHGGGSDNGQLYYVMEIVDGGTVKDLLQNGASLSWTMVIEIARQICSALQFAHNHGVIHRDLKPGNLFLTKSAQLKLGDFGIARDINTSDLTDAGLTVGTHAYMAPEQITGDNMISGKADLYALGCCLFEMLTGRKPFLGENFAQLFEQHLRATPPRVRDFVPHCPEALDNVVAQLLEKSPEDRPFNARQVQAVMLRLDEQHAAEVKKMALDADVAADRVAEVGRLMLEKQIAGSHLQPPLGEVSLAKLFVMALLLIGVVAIAAMMGT
ncbi:MAG: serine/threonine protein kinase [Pirellulales bacterium]|nr:serine/threonine protein kinase [Pirellulales bacterium]